MKLPVGGRSLPEPPNTGTRPQKPDQQHGQRSTKGPGWLHDLHGDLGGESGGVSGGGCAERANVPRSGRGKGIRDGLLHGDGAPPNPKGVFSFAPDAAAGVSNGR
jgi:hypothetical protein